VSYAEYLLSSEWQARRQGALERAGHRCQLCYSKMRLEVHHRTYERLGHELPDDLVVLCDRCHERHSVALPSPVLWEIQDGRPWYPVGRAGEIIRELELTTDWERTRVLLAEKIELDRARAGVRREGVA